jgi:ABC-type transport system substrate-binding protein
VASWERLLLNTESESRGVPSVIEGAGRLVAGEATELTGFHIVSPAEFYVDLTTPIAFFPAMISYAAMAIVPEGTTTVGATVREGAVGTGAFRVVGFEPGRRLELERNPHYWRRGSPRSDGIVFHFGMTPEEIRTEFVADRLSIARDLLPTDAEALRHDPRFASGYRESARLSTYFVVLNSKRGPFRDLELRRGLARAIDVPGLVRRTLGRLAIPALGLIPPGLLGYSAAGPGSGVGSTGPAARSDSSVEATVSRESVELSAAVNPVFLGEFSNFYRELAEAFAALGYRIRPVNKTMAEI